MGLDKAIKSGKEWRKPYRKSARFDPSCRHQGGTIPCPWCRENKLHQENKIKQSAEDQIRENR